MTDDSTILAWTEKQDDWARDALRRQATSAGFALSADDKAEILARVRFKAGFPADTAPDHSPLTASHLSNQLSAGPRTVLCSLGQVKNIGRLAGGQTLSFAIDGITLVYGDNGSGKSGYCRITKKLCRSLSKDDLLGNVFEPGEKPPAEVIVRLRPDGETDVTEIAWVDGFEPPAALRSISVFDSHNARLYVTEQNRIEYLPSGIALLERHAAHRGEMAVLFEAERKQLEAQIKPALPIGYALGGVVEKTVGALVLKSKLPLPSAETLTDLAKWNESDQTELEQVDRDLATDPIAAAGRAARCAKALETLLKTVVAVERQLSEVRAASLKSAATASSIAAAAAKVAASDQFKDEPLGDVGLGAWRAMYDHAKVYIDSLGLGGELPADEGDPCALCQQPLQSAGSQRLKKFQVFVAGSTAKAADAARVALEENVALLDELMLPKAVALAQGLAEFAALGKSEKGLSDSAIAYFAAAEARLSALKGAAEAGNFDAVPVKLASIEPGLKAAFDQLTAASILQDEATLKTNRVALTQKQGALKDRKKLSGDLPTVLARRNDLERLSRVIKCLELVGTLKVSTQITAARRKVVSTDLTKRIQAEIGELDLTHIPFSVTDGSREGESWFEVGLSGAVPVANDKILSEGEQRALALACFLGEVAGEISKNGLVIDDPVSSLDHLRVRRVAERLVAEAAKGRQVIIFTHNLLFYSEVVEAAARATPQVPLVKRMVSKSQEKGFGLISESDEPWLAQKVSARVVSLQERINVLNDIQDFNTDSYRGAVKDFYTDLRETWERLVEELLFRGVVERFNSGVKTQSLHEVEVHDEDYKTIFWEMKRTSEKSGHDKAASKNTTTIAPADLKKDLETLNAYRKDLTKRKADVSKRRKALEGPPPGVTV